MLTATLIRLRNNDTGSEGVMLFGQNKALTLELPWRNNEPSYSCIPPGKYLCEWWKSPSKGWCFKLRGVPERSYILIHSATWAGDRKQGMRSDLRGCIALGKNYGSYQGQRGIFVSRPTVRQFNEFFGQGSFILEIKHAEIYKEI